MFDTKLTLYWLTTHILLSAYTRVTAGKLGTLLKSDVVNYVCCCWMLTVPHPCTSVECDNIKELFPLVVQSVASHS